jgi:hypothetical protein
MVFVSIFCSTGCLDRGISISPSGRLRFHSTNNVIAIISVAQDHIHQESMSETGKSVASDLQTLTPGADVIDASFPSDIRRMVYHALESDAAHLSPMYSCPSHSPVAGGLQMRALCVCPFDLDSVVHLPATYDHSRHMTHTLVDIIRHVSV